MDPFSLSVLFSCFRQRDLLMGIFFLSFHKFAYMYMCIKGDYWKKLFSFTWFHVVWKPNVQVKRAHHGFYWLLVVSVCFGFGVTLGMLKSIWFWLIPEFDRCTLKMFFSKFHLIVWSLMKPRRVWFLFIMIHVICISSYYVFIFMFSYLNLLISIMMVIVFD